VSANEVAKLKLFSRGQFNTDKACLPSAEPAPKWSQAHFTAWGGGFRFLILIPLHLPEGRDYDYDYDYEGLPKKSAWMAGSPIKSVGEGVILTGGALAVSSWADNPLTAMKNALTANLPGLADCRRIFRGAAVVVSSAAMVWSGAAQNAPKLISEPDISMQNEVRHAVDKGVAWLEKNQSTNGSWSSEDQPALTAMVLVAIRGRTGRLDEQAEQSSAVKKGYAYLMSCVQPDGGIYRNGLASYNTAVVLMALVIGHPPEYAATIAAGRKFLIGLQFAEGQEGNTNSALTGGFGYGVPKDKRPDLASTMQVLEALYYTKRPTEDKAGPVTGDLNWQAAIHFVQSCQNLPGYNKESWASDDPQNKGGFIYTPGVSYAGQTNLPSGRVALRSYGSMSYAGLLSYIYADLKLDDPRVTAALDWLRGNFTLDENPGLGAQGLFYYYFVMTKALTLCNLDTLETKDGWKINWRQQLALKLINLQKADGSWSNDNGRWWEKDPVLDTAYCLLMMEMIERKI